MEEQSKLFVVGVILGSIVGVLVYFALIVSYDYNVGSILTEEEMIKEFYETENAVHVSPHGIRKHMGEGDDSFILVDLRSQEEYETEHIVGAISIPAYQSPDKSAYSDVDRIVNSFSELIAENPGKEIIVYCYSAPCMTGRKIGKMLADESIYVKHLGVGWNEWRYQWDIWNHDSETSVNPFDYLASGPEPGIPPLEPHLISSGVCNAEIFGC